MELVNIAEVNHYIGESNILKDINLVISSNEIVTLIGPNGAGKSTLIKILLRLITPSNGLVTHAENLAIGYVPQSLHLSNLIPLTVERFLKLVPNVNEDLIDIYAKKTGIHKKLKNSIHTLSGGELQRTLLTRALLVNPQLLVLDEPVQGVDIKGQAELYKLIKEISKDIGCSVIMVSHDLHIVMAETNRVICLNKHICCHGNANQVSKDPEFTKLFGVDVAESIALYAHRHNHQHTLDGDIC